MATLQPKQNLDRSVVFFRVVLSSRAALEDQQSGAAFGCALDGVAQPVLVLVHVVVCGSLILSCET